MSSQVPKGARAIPLYSRGRVVGFALVDAEDYQRANAHKWHRVRKGRRFYAVTYIPCEDGGVERVYMQHFIFGKAPVGMVVDHLSGEPLDNRRMNLRFATPLVNARNADHTGKLGMYGVIWDARRGLFFALTPRGTKGKSRRRLGAFLHLDDAGRARDAWVREHDSEGGHRYNFDLAGNRVWYGAEFDHQVSYQPHRKSCPYYNVSLLGHTQEGTPRYRVDLMVKGKRLIFPLHHDAAQAARTADEARVANGLKRKNFKDVVGEVVVLLGIGYEVVAA